MQDKNMPITLVQKFYSKQLDFLFIHFRFSDDFSVFFFLLDFFPLAGVLQTFLFKVFRLKYDVSKSSQCNLWAIKALEGAN